MSKVKNDKKPKVSLEDILEKETPEAKCASFSFSHLTKNKSYNFKHFEKVCNIRKEAEAYRQLDKLLLDLSINRWVDIICRLGYDFNHSAYDHGS